MLDLDLDELADINRVYLTHTHLDHIAGLPLLLDAVQRAPDNPLKLFAAAEVIDVLRQHVFNWQIWPDFFDLRDGSKPLIEALPLAPGDEIDLAQGRVTVLPVRHSVPAVGYLIEGAQSVLAFSGDCGPNECLWEALNRLPSLDYLIVECSYANEDEALSRKAVHYCAATLAEDLRKLRHQPDILITHLKPGHENNILGELAQGVPDRKITALRSGQIIPL